MRLIDADALEYLPLIASCGNGKYNTVKVLYERDIENAPTVDAVEVVRCKNCACFRTDEKNITYCASMGVQMELEDFCSYGEVKHETD